MLDQGNRTFICSVVFIDLVGYSKKSVSEQITIRDRFTTVLSESLKDIRPDQRIVLDTGDGAAISFLGDPEDALFVALNMRDMLKHIPAIASQDTSPSEATDTSPLEGLLRIGINLGPVKLVRDINAQPNIVGDAINVAQRIMSFAQPGQIVASRSYYDMVACLSDAYTQLFKYEGSRTDKHVREHEIYIVGESDTALKQAKAGLADRVSSTNPRGQAHGASVSTGPNSPATNGTLPFLQDRKKLTIVGGILSLVIIGMIIMLAYKKPAPVAPAKGSSSIEVPIFTPPTNSNLPVTEPVKPHGSTGAASPATPETSKDTVKPAAEPGKNDPAKNEPAKSTVPGTVTFTIQPWGEVFINGKSIGVSPPLKSTKLAPGKYKVEVKNTTFTPYSATIEVKSKEEFSIKHKF